MLCSRFQKIVEEGPPIAVPPETMRKMELAAANLALMVNYTHAGTVEYLFLPETSEFYFLELNPRLQVCLMRVPHAPRPGPLDLTRFGLPRLRLTSSSWLRRSSTPSLRASRAKTSRHSS